jgi:hypothetical protein
VAGGQGGDLAGEPGWTLERLELGENFRATHPFISSAHLDELDELKRSGESQAFWMETQEQGENVVSASTFWMVVADAFSDFVQLRPEKKKEYDLISAIFPQLLRASS